MATLNSTVDFSSVSSFSLTEWLGEMPDHREPPSSVKVGYEMSFTRYFYKPQPLRSLEEIRADIRDLECVTRSLLAGIINCPNL